MANTEPESKIVRVRANKFSRVMNKNYFIRLIGASFILAAAGNNASAQAQSQGPISTSTPVPATLTEWNNPLEFSQFNPALGTLISVELNLSTTVSSTLVITNTSSSSSGSTAFTEVQITVQDPGNNLTVGNQPQLDVSTPNFSATIPGDSSVTSGVLTNSGSYSTTLTQASILSEFTGTGNVTLNAGTFTQAYTSDTTGDTDASETTEASLTGNVTYNFDPTPTPEPSSLALMLVGFSALGLRARKFKRS